MTNTTTAEASSSSCNAAVVLSLEELQKLVKRVNKHLKQFGFECAAFKVQWYNECIQDKRFQLSYPGETIALITISNPDMWHSMKKLYFEPPYGSEEDVKKDPVHFVTKYYTKQAILSQLHMYDTDVLYDFDMKNNMPRLLVQTAGHVAGIAYYYQRQASDPPEIKYGTAIHKDYGGWFGFRAGIFLKNVTCPEFKQQAPAEVVREKRVELLTLFNKFDNRFRDIIPVAKRYSQKPSNFSTLFPRSE